jgi:MFS family permease
LGRLNPSMIANVIRMFRENRVLLVICLVIMVNQLGFGIIVPVTPIYARTFGVNEGAIGLVIAVYGLGRFLFSAAAFAGFAYATGYPLFILSAVLWGVGVAGSGSASATYAADQAPPGANGITMGIYRMLSDLGYVSGPAVLGVAAEFAGAQTALSGSAALALVATLPFLILAPETLKRRRAPVPVGS